MTPMSKTVTTEIILREYIREQINDGNQIIIAENSITKAAAGNAVQFLVAGAAEYGLGAITMPAAGSGMAVGPTAETMVDALFGAEAITAAVESATKISNELGEFGDTFSSAASAYSGGDLDGYYDSMVKMSQQAVRLIGEKADEALDDVAEKIKDALQKVIRKLIKAVNSGLKLIIPDATLGAAAATAIEAAAMSAAENSYNLLVSATEKVQLLKDFIADPGIAADFFKKVLTGVVNLLNEFGEKIKEQGKTILGKAKAIAKYGPGLGPLVLKFGPDGFQKLGELIQEKIPGIMKLINGVLKVLVPMLITAVGFLQILLSGDWKTEEGEGEDEGSDDGIIDADGDGRADEARYISKTEIRNIIFEITRN